MSERLYYFKAGDGNEYGPISPEEVTAWQKQSRMNSESLVRREGSDDWVPLGRVPELASAQPPPPLPAARSVPRSGLSHSQTQTEQSYYESHRGGLILGLGITSIVIVFLCGILPVGIFFGIPAWIMGRLDMRKLNAGEMDPSGIGATKAGLICGIIGTIISLLIIVAVVGLILVGIESGEFDNFPN